MVYPTRVLEDWGMSISGGPCNSPLSSNDDRGEILTKVSSSAFPDDQRALQRLCLLHIPSKGAKSGILICYLVPFAASYSLIFLFFDFRTLCAPYRASRNPQDERHSWKETLERTTLLRIFESCFFVERYPLP